MSKGEKDDDEELRREMRKTLARLMREAEQRQERSLIQQAIANVKAELADEELEVKAEITDADTLQKWCQPVSSSSAADADASNAAASSDADADASKEEPEAAGVSASTSETSALRSRHAASDLSEDTIWQTS